MKTLRTSITAFICMQFRKLLPSHLVKVTQRKMDILNYTDSENLAAYFPGEKREAGVRDVYGKYSIPIDENWRIVFGWDQDNVIDVEVR